MQSVSHCGTNGVKILFNINSCLIKFKIWCLSKYGHPTFWHCLGQELREPFWRSKILLCCLLSWTLQPSSKCLQMTPTQPPLLLFWRHSAPQVFRVLTLFSSSVLKAMYFSFQFHNQIMKSSFYDFPACPESASNLVTLYGAGGLTYL